MNSLRGFRFLLFAAVLLGAFPALSLAAEPRELYAAPLGSCDGYPRLDIGTLPGMCAGLVIGPTHDNKTRQMVLPRSLIQLDDSTWLISDLAGC